MDVARAGCIGEVGRSWESEWWDEEGGTLVLKWHHLFLFHHQIYTCTDKVRFRLISQLLFDKFP